MCRNKPAYDFNLPYSFVKSIFMINNDQLGKPRCDSFINFLNLDVVFNN